MSSSFVPNEETDFIPENILLTGGAGKYQCFICAVYVGYILGIISCDYISRSPVHLSIFHLTAPY